MNSHAALEILESGDEGQIRLTLTGELDMATVGQLERRLSELRARQLSVRLDLSELGFMDSSGLHILIRAATEIREDGWRLEVEPDVSPQVRRLFQVVGLEHLFLAEVGTEC